jgi:hypothetical protein
MTEQDTGHKEQRASRNVMSDVDQFRSEQVHPRCMVICYLIVGTVGRARVAADLLATSRRQTMVVNCFCGSTTMRKLVDDM